MTKGREIENYIPTDDLEKSVKAVHPSAKSLVSTDQWANTLKYLPKKKKEEKTANKVKVAIFYANNYMPDIKILDLKEQIVKLKLFIYDSNGMKI